MTIIRERVNPVNTKIEALNNLLTADAEELESLVANIDICYATLTESQRNEMKAILNSTILHIRLLHKDVQFEIDDFRFMIQPK